MEAFSYNLDIQNLGLSSSFNYYSSKSKTSDLDISDLQFSDFQFPPISNAWSFCEKVKDSSKEGKKLMDFYHGTTTLGFSFKDGIILAVDSRASMGSIVSSEHVRKILEINDYLLGTMAGGAADCQFWERYLAMECKLYELKHNERLSVAAASKILSNITYHYRKYGLSMGTMIAGWDNTGPNLYYVDDDGSRLKGNIFSVGSGSTYAYGVLDSYYKPEMNLKDAIELGMTAIYHATHRDSGSGGYARVYHIHKDGWTKIYEGEDVNMLHYSFAKKKGLIGDGDETKNNLL